jgi:hypothetical protein
MTIEAKTTALLDAIERRLDIAGLACWVEPQMRVSGVANAGVRATVVGYIEALDSRRIVTQLTAR